MNSLELAVQRVFENHGWEVFRRGWPDLLCVKDEKVQGIEVKSVNDRVRPEQERIHNILRANGST
jgi:hypothetical protein